MTSRGAQRVAFLASEAEAAQQAIVELRQPNAAPGAQEQAFTLIVSGDQAWLVAPLTNEPNAPLKARTLSSADIGKTLLRGL